MMNIVNCINNQTMKPIATQLKSVMFLAFAFVLSFLLLIFNPPAYHMRTHIAKVLQSRCKAIQNAVKTYNTAAA